LRQKPQRGILIGKKRMSTPFQDTSGEQTTPRGSAMPSPLALLGATALGGVIGSRMNSTPLVIAAGAATLALLRKKAQAPTAPPPVQPPQVQQPQNLIKQWLEQQTEREQRVPVVPLTLLPGPEDHYTPMPLLNDDPIEASSVSLRQEVFASLTEPNTPAFRPAPQVELEMPAVSGWIPGIDPLPSWNETPDPPVFAEEPGFPKDEASIEPVLEAPVFAGGVLPDEIEVAEPPEITNTLQEEALMKLFTPAESSPSAQTEHAREIPVQLAQPGEASFDSPMLSAVWPPPEAVALPVQPVTPVIVEAEIILRPRAPTHNTVTSKAAPFSATLAPLAPADAEITGTAAEPIPRAPVQSPREQLARSSWRSWWRGD
jgi:hypothetical protein